MEENWSEQVEDLIAAGDADAAISLLESVASNLHTPTLTLTLTLAPSSSDPQLASALTQLAKLYSFKGFSLKADLLIQQHLLHSSSCVAEGTLTKESKKVKCGSSSTTNHEFLTDGILWRFFNLSEEIMAEIISRLPLKSILRCKSVQKSWYFLIKSLMKNQLFLAKHYKISEKQTSIFFGLQRVNLFLSIHNAKGDNESINLVVEDLSLPVLESFGTHGCGSNVNGIMCLPDGNNEKVLVCNPATMEFQLLQNSSLNFSDPHFCSRLVGFGYDIIDDVYKVVRVVHSIPTLSVNGRAGAPVVRAEVCTLGIDSWKEIKMPIKINNFPRGKQLYFKGFHYWLVCVFNTEMILCFDFHKEVFHTRMLPPRLLEVGNNNGYGFSLSGLWLTLWNESIALLEFPRRYGTTGLPIEMWIMEECSGSGSCWSKSLSVHCPGIVGFYHPLTLWKDDELLMKQVLSQGLCLLNLRTQKVRKVKLPPQFPYSVGAVRALAYVQTLASFKTKKQCF